MKWSPNLFIIGFMFIIVGLILVLITSSNFESGFFFIFPFFFFGSSGHFSTYIVLGLVSVIFFVMILLLPALLNRLDSEEHPQDMYIPVGSICEFCKNPVPVNATFCSVCGNAIDQSNYADERT